MGYVLGLIFADGAILDVRKSSRTCYVQIASNDKAFLKKNQKDHKLVALDQFAKKPGC